MKTNNVNNPSKGEYISPSYACIDLEPSAVVCSSLLDETAIICSDSGIENLDTITLDDSIWNSAL